MSHSGGLLALLIKENRDNGGKPKDKGHILAILSLDPPQTQSDVNDVNNQQDATTFSFINLFNSALRVSGDKFAHPQEHF